MRSSGWQLELRLGIPKYDIRPSTRTNIEAGSDRFMGSYSLNAEQTSTDRGSLVLQAAFVLSCVRPIASC